MIFMLTMDQARHLAGIAKAASSDTGRPVLQAILIEWGPSEFKEGGGYVDVRWTATNSYLLASRVVAVPTERCEVSKTSNYGSVLVNGKDIAAAVAAAVKAVGRSPIPTFLGFEVPDNNKDQGGIQLATYPGEDFAMMVPRNGGIVGATYPNWKQLAEDQTVEFNGQLPAFNPIYLKQVMDTQGGRPTEWTVPVRATSKGEGGELKPWGFKVLNKELDSEWFGLLMPVRV